MIENGRPGLYTDKYGKYIPVREDDERDKHAINDRL